MNCIYLYNKLGRCINDILLREPSVCFVQQEGKKNLSWQRTLCLGNSYNSCDRGSFYLELHFISLLDTRHTRHCVVSGFFIFTRIVWYVSVVQLPWCFFIVSAYEMLPKWRPHIGSASFWTKKTLCQANTPRVVEKQSLSLLNWNKMCCFSLVFEMSLLSVARSTCG